MPLPILSELSPLVQGLFGGAGATLLWELVLRPSRERRQAARVIAQEVSLCLQLAATARYRAEENSSGIAADFSLPTLAFSAIGGSLGALPTEIVGEVVGFYHYVGTLNVLPGNFGSTLDRYRSLAIVGDTEERQRLKGDLDDQLAAYRSGLEFLAAAANKLLPKLRRLSMSWWRVDYLLSEKKQLSAADVQRAADGATARHAAALAVVRARNKNA